MSGPHPTSSLAGRVLVLGLWLIGSSACIREQLPDICPSVEVGELVISELSATNTTYYVELYNASGKTLDLYGLVIHIVSSDADMLICRASIEIEAGDYAVIAPGFPGDVPLWIDCPFGTDAKDEFLPESVTSIELEACGEIIDEVIYDVSALPEDATLACATNGVPNADENDAVGSGCWCRGPLVGSPGESNECLP